jgi:hypothetical protein
MRWTQDQADRRAEAENGKTVVASMYKDKALVSWARRNGRSVYIGRGSIWGNPFVVPLDGSRDEVCDKYASSFKLHNKLGLLRGKVLVCYCHPERCHGHFLAKLANTEKTP